MTKRKEWFIKTKRADFDGLAKKFHISPIVVRCIINRDVVPEDFKKFLNGTKKDFYSPYLIPRAEDAANLIIECVDKKMKIRIIGDYDMDGIGGTYTYVTGIRKIGGDVDYAIPHRIEDGYGLNTHLIEQAKQDGIEVIITCDNGIAAVDAIKLAKSYGMIVIVTDHHEVPYKEDSLGRKRHIIPKADIVVDTKINDKHPYPQIGICGAEIAYKIIEIVYEKKKVAKKYLDNLLQVVAMSTVCDVMELVDENRLVVKEGLKLINSAPIVGVKALIDACGLRNVDKNKEITAGHIGFTLGPTCNASGRLDTASKAVELFLCEDESLALDMANELRAINDTRKGMTEAKTDDSYQLIDNSPLNQDTVLVVLIEDCHESLAGIIAGKIREKYNKPAIVFTKTADGYKGSGRSIEAYDMYAKLNECRELFTKFGGHKMAAGMSLESEDKINQLRTFLNAHSDLTPKDLVEITRLDMELPFSKATLDVVEELDVLGPFGTANPTPIFGAKATIVGCRELGASHRAMRYLMKDAYGDIAEVYDFGDIDNLIDFLKEKYGDDVLDRISQGEKFELTIAYKVSVNTYNGKSKVQFVIVNYK